MMSYVCDVILVCECGNEDEPFNPDMEPLQAFLSANHGGAMLKRVDDHAGGSKHIQANIWMGAFNHLNADDLLSVFRGITWERPECIQLLLKNENDDRFAVYVPETHQVEGDFNRQRTKITKPASGL